MEFTVDCQEISEMWGAETANGAETVREPSGSLVRTRSRSVPVISPRRTRSRTYAMRSVSARPFHLPAVQEATADQAPASSPLTDIEEAQPPVSQLSLSDIINMDMMH